MVPEFTHSFAWSTSSMPRTETQTTCSSPLPPPPNVLTVLLLQGKRCSGNGSPSDSQFYPPPSSPTEPLGLLWPCPRTLTLRGTQGRQCQLCGSPRNRNQAWGLRQKQLTHFPYVWRIPKLICLKRTLRIESMPLPLRKTALELFLPKRFSQKDSASEPSFKTLVKQSLYLPTGEFKGFPLPLNSEHSLRILNRTDSMHFLSTWLFRNAKYTCALHLKASER